MLLVKIKEMNQANNMTLKNLLKMINVSMFSDLILICKWMLK